MGRSSRGQHEDTWVHMSYTTKVYIKIRILTDIHEDSTIRTRRILWIQKYLVEDQILWI